MASMHSRSAAAGFNLLCGTIRLLVVVHANATEPVSNTRDALPCGVRIVLLAPVTARGREVSDESR